MLYIGEEVGTRQRAEGRHRPRSARGHDDLRQEPAERARGDRHRRGGQPAQRARRLHGEDRHRPRLSARASSISTRRPPRTSARWPEAKGVAGRRDHRLRPRPAAPCPADRGDARDRRRDPADRRRRRRRRDPHHRARTRPASTSIIGIGGAPEGVLAAAALRCIGGQMQGRLVINSERAARARASAWASPTSTANTT